MKQHYDSYKPSGVDWIGEIPSHWELLRMRFLCDMITGDKDTINKVDDGEYPFYVRSPQIERINSYSFDGEAVLMAGDGVGAGKVVHYANGKFDFHQRVYNFHNFKGIKGILLFHYLKTLFKYKIEEGGAKNTVDSVRQPWLKDFPICVPPIREQEAIATWLDEKCGEIDSAIVKVEREIELIDELKQSEISRVVTRGLNPDVPLRPSGIDWIGYVPEHWEIAPLKRNVKEPLKYGANEPAESDNTDYPRYIRITDIDPNGNLRPETFKSLEPSKAEEYLLKKGDVLFARSGATVGKTYIFEEDYDACFAGYLIKATCSKALYPKFLFYYTLSGEYENWKNSIFIQATIQNIGADKYSLLPLPLPPLSEQQAIADYLDKKCAEIDGLKEKLVKKRDTLKELRQAIISEVVTGKRKVI